MAIQHDKAALLAALRKPALSKPQVEEIMSQATIPAAKPPTPPQHVSPWRIGKEAMGLLADGLAVWPMLTMTYFSGFDDLLHHMWA